jgi:hypothetical protein
MEIPPLPPLSEELIRALELRFPDRCPDLSMADREIWHYAGQRHVVEFRKGQHELQQETRFDNVLRKDA